MSVHGASSSILWSVRLIMNVPIDKDKDVLLDCIEKVKVESGCNDIILVTDAETLKNIDRLYGYKVVHMDNIYKYENFEWIKMNSHQVYITPRNESIGIKYKIVFDEED